MQIDEITSTLYKKERDKRQALINKELSKIDRKKLMRSAKEAAAILTQMGKDYASISIFHSRSKWDMDKFTPSAIEKNAFEVLKDKIEEKHDDPDRREIRSKVVLTSIDCVNYAELKRALSL